MNKLLSPAGKRQDAQIPPETKGKVFTILLAEDAIAERTVLTAILKKQDYSVIAVTNGEEALEALENHSVDLVLSDWKMPVMDGFTLCKKVHENNDLAPYFILLTGQDSKCNLIAAMDAGADDFITKPYNSEELRARLQAGQRVISMRKSLQEKNQFIAQALQRESTINEQLHADLVAAEKLQRSLLPSGNEYPDKLALAHYFRASNGVAGDAFNILPLDDDHIAFYHIDVAGHGVRAAMHSFNISRQLSDPNQLNKLRQLNETTGQISITSPSQVISEFNRQFNCKDECTDYYTMIYGVLNCRTGEGVFSQAGMPLPMLIRSSTNAQNLGSGGFPVGMFEEASYNDHLFTLQTGERLVLYSDGILSCKLSSGEELSQKTLCKILQKLSGINIRKLHKKMPEIFQQIIQESSYEDDISIMILERASVDKNKPSRRADSMNHLSPSGVSKKANA